MHKPLKQRLQALSARLGLEAQKDDREHRGDHVEAAVGGVGDPARKIPVRRPRGGDDRLVKRQPGLVPLAQQPVDPAQTRMSYQGARLVSAARVAYRADRAPM